MDRLARQLVVDASVALAADSETETCAEDSRRFLNTMARGSAHAAVMTEPLEEEWRQREKSGTASPFALPWLAWMRRKSRIIDADAAVKILPDEIAAIATQLGKCQVSAAVIQAMLEDLHLLEAALVTERTVVSADGKVRGYYGSASIDIEVLREICWVNPCVADEEAVSWLQKGAAAEPARKLSFYRR